MLPSFQDRDAVPQVLRSLVVLAAGEYGTKRALERLLRGKRPATEGFKSGYCSISYHQYRETNTHRLNVAAEACILGGPILRIVDT